LDSSSPPSLFTMAGKRKKPKTKPKRKDGGPRDHRKCLAAICACCGRKDGLRPIKEDMAEKIRTQIPELHDFSLASLMFPSSICGACRLTITEMDKKTDSSAQLKRKMPPLLDYAAINARSSRAAANHLVLEDGAVCGCTLCEIARGTLDRGEFHAAHSNPRGRPRDRDKTPELSPIRICPKCKGQIGPGLHKDCSRASLQRNMEDVMTRELSDRTRDKVDIYFHWLHN